MLLTEPIDSKIVAFQGKTITIKEHCRLLKRQENIFPILQDAIEFCRHQIKPNNSWGIWYSIISSWKEMGLTNREIFQVILQSNSWGQQYIIYGAAKRELCMKMLNDVELAEEYCNDAVTHPEVYYSGPPYFSANEGVVILAKHSQLIEKYTPLISWKIPEGDRRIILTSLPIDVRNKVLLNLCARENFTNNTGAVNPRYAFMCMRSIVDLLPEALQPVIDEFVAELEKNRGGKSEEIAEADSLIQIMKSKEPWQPPLTPEGITASADQAVKYLTEQQKVHARLSAFDSFIEALNDRHITIDAKELNSIDDWKKASHDRRSAIVKSIEKAMDGLKFTGFAENELCIAQFKHKASKQVLSLVPGGEVEMGLSDAEEKLLREYLESRNKKLSEEDGEILNAIDQMRPVKKIHIEPMLVAQKISVKGDIPALLDWLEAQSFRLPSEAEWEYLARGTKQQELTWNGHVIPDKTWMKEIKQYQNVFCLGEFGLRAEICSDVWKPTHTAMDHKPVVGEGPRVCRGGAADLAPWQNCGEWHLLCTAFRYSAEGMLLMAGRAVIGIEITNK